MSGTKCRVIADFQATDAGELSLVEGDMLILLEADDSGWAKGLLNGVKGWFPAEFVEPILNEGEPEASVQEEEAEVPADDGSNEGRQTDHAGRVDTPIGHQSPVMVAKVAKEQEVVDEEDDEEEDSSDADEEDEEDEVDEVDEGSEQPEAKVAEKMEPSLPASETFSEEEKSTEQTLKPLAVSVPLPEEEKEPSPVPSISFASMESSEQRTVPETERSKRNELPAELARSPRSYTLRALVSPREVLTSQSTSGSRNVRVTVIKKNPMPNATARESILNCFVNNVPLKAELYSQVLCGPGAGVKFHESALQVYEGYLDEIYKTLKIIRNRELRGLAAPTSPADPLNTSNASRLLEIFRNFIVAVGSEELMEFGMKEAIEIILNIARQLKIPSLQATREDRKFRKPTTARAGKDADANLLETKNTAHEFLLSTLRDILRLRLEGDGDACPVAQMSSANAADVIDFAFNSLFFVNELVAQKIAGECLGLLSNWHLDAIVVRFTKELSKCKTEDDYTQYCSYQRAVKSLRFGFSDATFSSTVQYLGFITSQIDGMKKNHVFKNTVAESLIALLTNIKTLEQLGRLQTDERGPFISALYRIYELVKKWYKNSKTKGASFKLQLFLYRLLDAQKMDLCNKDIIKMLQEVLRDKSLRLEAIEAYGYYVRSLPTNVTTSNLGKVWTAQANALLPSLFVKKAKDVTPAEWKEITGIASTMTSLDHGLLSHDTLVGVLKSSDYLIEARSAVLRAVGTVFATSNDLKEDGLEYQAAVLQPVITDILRKATSASSSAKYRGLLDSVLLCFPHLCTPEKRTLIATSVVPFAFSADPEISTSSLQSLQNYMLQDGAENVVFLLNAVLHYLLERCASPAHEAVAHCRNVTRLISTFLHSRRQTEAAVMKTLSSPEWPQLRTLMEALGLCWSVHSDASVRAEAVSFLAMITLELAEREEKAKKGRKPVLFLSKAIDADMLKRFPLRREFICHISDRLLEGKENYANVVAEAWIALRNQWVLKEHVEFFIKTAVIVTPLKDCAEVLNEVFGRIVACLFENVESGTEEFQTLIIVTDALELMDLSVVEAFIRITLADEAAAKKKKTMRKAKSDLAASSEVHMLRAYQILCNNFTPDLFRSSEVIKSFLRDRISFWKERQDEVGYLGIPHGYFLATVVGKAIELEASVTGEDEVSIDLAVGANEALMRILEELVADDGDEYSIAAPPVSDPSALRRPFRVAVMKSVCQFFKHAPCEQERLVKQWLPFLFKCYERWGACVEEHAVSALRFFLNRYPDTLKSFVRQSLQCEDTAVSAGSSRTRHANLQLFACAANFLDNPNAWLETAGSERMLFIALVHLCSSQPKSREQAVKIANMLSQHDPSLSPGFLLSSPPNLAYHMFIELAMGYSRALASKCPQLTAPLMREFTFFYAELSDQQKSVVLHLLNPWCKNFTKVVAISAEHGTEMLNGLLSCSMESDKVYHRDDVQTLWLNLFDFENTPESMRVAVDVLIREYRDSQNENEDCAMSFSSLTRTKIGASVVTYVVSKLRDYPAIPSVQSADIPHIGLVKDSRTEAEIVEADLDAFSAFKLLSYISLEKGQLLSPYLSTILHNAIILYEAEEDSHQDAFMLVENVIQCMLRELNVADEIRKEAVILQENLKETLQSICHGQFEPAVLERLITCFSPICPKLREEWCNVSLQWGLGCLDNARAVASLEVFKVLREQLEPRLIHQIATCLLVSMYNGWAYKIEKLEDTLLDLIKLHAPQPGTPVSTEMVKVAVCLLCSCSHQQVGKSLQMLQCLLPDFESRKSFASIVSGLFSDQSVLNSLMLRPVLLLETRDVGIWLLRVVDASSSPADRSYPRLLNLIVSAVLALQTDSLRNDLYTWLASDEGKASCFADAAELFSQQNFHLKDESRAKFVGRISDCVLSKFTGRDNLNYVVETLLVLLRNGPKAIKFACFTLLKAFMGSSDDAISPQQFKLLAEIVTFDCYSKSTDVRTAAERMLLDLISQFQENVVPAQVFALVRVVPEERTLTAGRLPALYPGDMAVDFSESLRSSILALYINCCDGVVGDTAHQHIDKHFAEPEKMSFPGFTDGTRLTAPDIQLSPRKMTSDIGPPKPKKTAPKRPQQQSSSDDLPEEEAHGQNNNKKNRRYNRREQRRMRSESSLPIPESLGFLSQVEQSLDPTATVSTASPNGPKTKSRT